MARLRIKNNIDSKVVAIQLDLFTSLSDNDVAGAEGAGTHSAPSQNRERGPAMTLIDRSTTVQGEQVEPVAGSVSSIRKTYP